MSDIVLVTHEGMRCALPAGQVAMASQRPPAEVEAVSLFGDSSADPASSGILVATPTGSRWLPCDKRSFAELDESTLCPLPELLRACVGRSWLVGLGRVRLGSDGGVRRGAPAVAPSRWRSAGDKDRGATSVESSPPDASSTPEEELVWLVDLRRFGEGEG